MISTLHPHHHADRSFSTISTLHPHHHADRSFSTISTLHPHHHADHSFSMISTRHPHNQSWLFLQYDIHATSTPPCCSFSILTLHPHHQADCSFSISTLHTHHCADCSFSIISTHHHAVSSVQYPHPTHSTMLTVPSVWYPHYTHTTILFLQYDIHTTPIPPCYSFSTISTLHPHHHDVPSLRYPRYTHTTMLTVPSVYLHWPWPASEICYTDVTHTKLAILIPKHTTLTLPTLQFVATETLYQQMKSATLIL